MKLTPEVLARVARCAPTKMRAKFMCSGGTDPDLCRVVFSVGPEDDKACFEHDGSEHCNATGVIAMLDALEQRDLCGLGPVVLVELIGSNRNEPDCPNWFCRRVVCPESDTPHVSAEGAGETRSEAVVEAFLACFEVKA